MRVSIYTVLAWIVAHVRKRLSAWLSHIASYSTFVQTDAHPYMTQCLPCRDGRKKKSMALSSNWTPFLSRNGKPYRLVIQRQRREDGPLDIWEGEYTYRCILTNDYETSVRDIVEFYNLRGGKERIFDDMNNGFGWNRLPKSFMAQNTVFLLMTAIIRNFYKAIILKMEVKKFGLKRSSRIKMVTRFVSFLFLLKILSSKFAYRLKNVYFCIWNS